MNINKKYNKELKRIFNEGFIEGLTLFAWWKDGIQYVGMTGKTLKQALKEFNNGKYDEQI